MCNVFLFMINGDGYFVVDIPFDAWGGHEEGLRPLLFLNTLIIPHALF